MVTSVTPTDADLLSVVTERAEAIAARIGTTTATGCWPWLGGKSYNGYGSFTVTGNFGRPESVNVGPYQSRSLRAHRAVFMLHHGRPIAHGMTLHHTCHRRECVNPAHLVEMTAAENNAQDATGGASIRVRDSKLGPRYSVCFREDGKQRSDTFDTPEAAEAFRALRLAGRS